MKFVARAVATVLLGALIWTPAFADETANAATNVTNTGVSDTNSTTDSGDYLSPTIPMPPPQAKVNGPSSNSDTHPIA